MKQSATDQDVGQRIIAATGLECHSIDAKQLARDLRISWSVFRSVEQTSPAATRQMQRELGRFASSARHLKLRMDSLGIRSRLKLRPRLAQHDLLEDHFGDLLQGLIMDAEAALVREDDAQSLEPGSVFERFVGVELTKIFETHFRLKPRFRRGANRQPTGPFIFFCQAALAELNIQHNGKSYSAEAIGRALTSSTTKKLRPKARLGKRTRET